MTSPSSVRDQIIEAAKAFDRAGYPVEGRVVFLGLAEALDVLRDVPIICRDNVPVFGRFFGFTIEEVRDPKVHVDCHLHSSVLVDRYFCKWAPRQ